VSGRSARTARLAERADLEPAPDLAAVVREADVVLSIVPPEAASSVVAELASVAASEGAHPLLVDLNAVAPATVTDAAAVAARGGCDLVDGSISGPPPSSSGSTRIYLSGPRADEVAGLPFDGVDVVRVGGAVGAASAVKMSTASIYKGTSALLVQALLAARSNGVLEHVLADLRAGSPESMANLERRLALAASKSGRYVGEMREIARAQDATGLTPSLFEAMADVYAALAASALADLDPEDVQPGDLEAVLAGLNERKEEHVSD
jgi:3-hydroxyisobutyrate dehydrogenase-like beta-hydroxyacid dehydrogenase